MKKKILERPSDIRSEKLSFILNQHPLYYLTITVS
jgi:hypothetical protein